MWIDSGAPCPNKGATGAIIRLAISAMDWRHPRTGVPCPENDADVRLPAASVARSIARKTRAPFRRKAVERRPDGPLASSLGIVSPSPAHAQTTLTPSRPWKNSVQGNERFARRAITSFQEDLDILQRRTAADKQEPFAAVLAYCRFQDAGRTRLRPIDRQAVCRPRGEGTLPRPPSSPAWNTAPRDTGHQGTGRPGPRRLRRDQGRGRKRGRARAISALYPYIRPAINAMLVHRYHRNGAAERHQPGAAAALGLARPGKTVRRRRVADPAGALRRRPMDGSAGSERRQLNACRPNGRRPPPLT